MFQERKVAHMAAYLLWKRGGVMSHLKLMKLLYLSDRECLNRFGRSMSGDCAVSMPHGPVLSQTLNLMDGDVESHSDGWTSWISDKENNELALKREITPNVLDELSEADFQILDRVFEQFGQMKRFEIRDYSHTLAEWQDPKGSSRPILVEEIFKALGKPMNEIEALMDRIKEDSAMDALFASL